MNQQLYIILYSKYSQNSNNLIKYIHQSQIDLINTIGLKFICIDNEIIRDRILNCKEVKINSVPTILVVYPNGGVEKYEGIKAFNWVEESINSLLPPPPPVHPIPPPPPPPTQTEFYQEEEEEEEEYQEEIPIPPKPNPKRPKNPNKENIIDLDSLDSEEEIKENRKEIVKTNNIMDQAMAMQKEREKEGL